MPKPRVIAPHDYVTHKVFTTNSAIFVPRVTLDPWRDVRAEAHAVCDLWETRLLDPRCLRLDWLLVEDFDVGRTDSTGALVGCTFDSFKSTLKRGYGMGHRDFIRLGEVVGVFVQRGLMPQELYIGSEHNSAPGPESQDLWSKLVALPSDVDRTWMSKYLTPIYNKLRLETVRRLLAKVTLDTLRNTAIDWMSLSSDEPFYCVDHNGARLGCNPYHSIRFAPCAQWYSGNPAITSWLALWLKSVYRGAKPYIDTRNSQHLHDSLELCGAFYATPIIWTDPRKDWPAVGWQLDQLAYALGVTK